MVLADTYVRNDGKVTAETEFRYFFHMIPSLTELSLVDNQTFSGLHARCH